MVYALLSSFSAPLILLIQITRYPLNIDGQRSPAYLASYIVQLIICTLQLTSCLMRMLHCASYNHYTPTPYTTLIKSCSSNPTIPFPLIRYSLLQVMSGGGQVTTNKLTS